MKKLSTLLVSAAAFSALAGGYAKYTDITITGYEGEAVADFPVLVKVTNAKLPGFSSDIRHGGKDVKFTSLDGETVLPFEFDTYDPSGTSLYWVRLPSLQAGAQFRMWYGNESVTNAPDATAVWDGCLVVLHFNSESKESSHGFVPHDYGTSSGAVSGPLGSGYTISSGAAGDRDGGIVLEGSEGLAVGNDFTIMFWAKHKYGQAISSREIFCQSRGKYYAYYGNNERDAGLGFAATSDSGGMLVGYDSSANTYLCPIKWGTMTTNDWTHYAVTLDHSGNVLVFNNARSTSTNTSATDVNNLRDNPNCPMVIGNSPALTDGSCTGTGADTSVESWKGAFDEFRIYSSVLPPARIALEYQNMTGDFTTFSPPVVDESESTSALILF